MADNTNQPMTDDAELAKVLEGMQNPATQAAAPVANGISFEPTMPAPSTPVPDSALPPVNPTPTIVPPASDSAPTADAMPAPDPQYAAAPAEPVIMPDQSAYAAPVDTDGGLESIKKDALTQLRPLVDKLELPPEEKFDTLLLIIRSTDDKSLVQSAYAAAKNIPDEGKRAEALLDVVKEIDYFSNPASGQPQL